MKLQYYIILLFISSMFISCANDMSEKLESVPPSFGKANEIIVLSDDMMWSGPVGDSLKFYYSAAFPITPSPEPIFDLRHFNHNQILKNRIFSQYRSYVITANLGDLDSPITQMVIKDIGEEKYRQALSDNSFRSIVGKNKWAKGQIIIYLFAPTESELIDVLKSRFPDVSRRIYDHDYQQLYANAFGGGHNVIAQDDIKKLYNISVDIPKYYIQARLNPEDETMWLRMDDAKSIRNIVVIKKAYTNESQFSKESIIEYMEEWGSTNIDDDKLRINDRDLPTYEFNRSHDNLYVKEIRGIWEKENGFMGGPYITHVIHEKDSNEMVILFSFLYAAGKKKRNMIQQLDIIMGTARSIQQN